LLARHPGRDLAMTTWLPRERACAKPGRSNAAMARWPEPTQPSSVEKFLPSC
jgi:hypothetical protein